MNPGPVATGVRFALRGSSPGAVGNEVDWVSWGTPAFPGVPGGPELLVLLLLIVLLLLFGAVRNIGAGRLRTTKNQDERNGSDDFSSEPDPDEGHGHGRDEGATANEHESGEDEEPTHSWSGLIIEEVRSRGSKTDVVIRNVVEEPWNPSNATIEDSSGNRHSLPASLNIAPGGSEIIRFDRDDGEVFRATKGEEVVIQTEEGERTILWKEPEE